MNKSPGLWVLLCFLLIAFMLNSCAKYHAIKTDDTPCICPKQKYSFRIVSDYDVRVDNIEYRVPANFITDLASIPRLLWVWFPPHDSRVVAPSILHDYFYSGETKVSRKFADDVFYNHMLVEGFPRYKAWLFWSGVRIFGWWSFKKGKSYD